MATTSSGNGVGRIAMLLGMATSTVVIIGVIGSTFFVAFSTRSNSEALAMQSIQITAMQSRIEVLTRRVSSQELALNEVETQFCASDNLRNEMHARDLRDFAVVFEKVFGQKFPIENAFYARVCNRRSGP